jgi:hypothetical protein
VFFAISTPSDVVKAIWESTGWHGLLFYNFNVKRGKQLKRVSDLIRFPWNDIAPNQTVSEDRKRVLIRQIEKNRDIIYGKWGLKKFDPANPPKTS